MHIVQNITVAGDPSNSSNRMEAKTPSGKIAVIYNNSAQELLRIALAIKATEITITVLH